tara:strand:- start:29 stop:3757 length:3729 start_codon:yes stop_codon:yes gene_type:complete
MNTYFYCENNCYNVKSNNELNEFEIELLRGLICDDFDKIEIRDERLRNYRNKIEIGPLLNFCTPWCSNAISILNKCGIYNITSIEITRFVDNADYDKMTECIYSQETNRQIKKFKKSDFYLNIDKLYKYNQKYSFGFDKYDINYYKNLFTKLGRNPTNVELFDLAQSNSEHSRHWTFISQLCMKNYTEPYVLETTLLKLIKATLNKNNNNNSILAFCDNSSAIRGYNVKNLIVNSGKYEVVNSLLHPVLTAETHNFPTGMVPFPGAATGIGGRIRDNMAVGRGGLLIAGTAGYSVGNLFISPTEWETKIKNFETAFKTPLDILIEASNGASDYGNKFGEPIILGFTRSFGLSLSRNNIVERLEYIKPIMFTGGIGQMRDEHKYKCTLDRGYLIVRVGGPVYRIGMGGGTASSRNQEDKNKKIDLDAVQRGDPEMENRVYKFIRSCIEMGVDNPILSIHDQGAGGMANVTKEIVEPNGGIVFLDNVILGDNTLSTSEIWSSEHQEQVSIIIHPKDSKLIKKIAHRENVPISFFGFITNNGKIEVYDKNNKLTNFPVSLKLDDISCKSINKTYNLYRNNNKLDKLIIQYGYNIKKALYNVFKLVSVGSKRFLTNKVDRSVSGLIAQQQCVGPYHTPLSNVAVLANSHFELTGIASSIGEQPIKGIIDNGCMVRMTVAEMLTNLMWAEISNFSDIKCSGNWMWALKGNSEEYHNLYSAVNELSDFLIKLGIAIDGGKDSLSMSVKHKQTLVKSPNTLVMSSYVTCPNILNVITPDFKGVGNHILFIDMGKGNNRLGGSCLAQIFKSVGNESPDISDYKLLRNVFLCVQALIKDNLILSGHDRSDGGLITTLCEMSISSDVGCEIYIASESSAYHYLFSEEVGLLLEVSPNNVKLVEKLFGGVAKCYRIGKTVSERNIFINFNGSIIFNDTIAEIRSHWEETNFKLELRQANNICVRKEKESLYTRTIPKMFINDYVIKMCHSFEPNVNNHKPKVVILRDEGSNGEREMGAAFYLAGFDVIDVTMNDLVNSDNDILSECSGIAFVGGFTYSDVFGAGVGWYNVIKSNKKISEQFDRFYNRKDTFSFGVCNGCQLMALLKWIPGNCRFVKNKSERFESRYSVVKIRKSPSIMLSGMEGTTMGIWIAHGEGRFISHNNSNMDNITPIQYVNDIGYPTENYPFNPNGSYDGITAVCSKDGRHLAMMPHPERCFMNWQLPWTPKDYPLSKDSKSPWMVMFYNAYKWCVSN